MNLIKTFERVLMAAALVGGAYIGYFFLVQNKSDLPKSHVEINAQAGSEEEPEELIVTKPYDVYSAQIDSRDIFGSIAAKTAESSTVAVATPTDQLPDYFKVVGIVVAHPTQVIIEDTRVHRTHFIEEGKANGEFAIKKVTPNKIIITYQGQSIAIAVKENRADAP